MLFSPLSNARKRAIRTLTGYLNMGAHLVTRGHRFDTRLHHMESVVDKTDHFANTFVRENVKSLHTAIGLRQHYDI